MCLRTSPSSRPLSAVMSRSSTNTFPLSGCTSPMMWRSVTLLPVPLRPSRQNACALRDLERHVVEHRAAARSAWTRRSRPHRASPSSRHRRIEEEDDLHEDHVAQDDQHRPHDDAARGRLADAFGAAAGREPEIARGDRNQVAEDDRLERRRNEIRVA